MLEQYSIHILKTLIEKMFNGFVMVDSNGYVTYLSEDYATFLKVDAKESVGKHVTEVIENTRMHIVAKTGKTEMYDLQYVRNNHMIANRIPLKKDGKVISVIGIMLYRDLHDFSKFNVHISRLHDELVYYKNRFIEQNKEPLYMDKIIGNSPSITQLKEQIKQIAPSNISILISGESGTGKELVARSIHQLSDRKHKPFIPVNCAAIPESLFESELFGYVEGAFTGAKKAGKKGFFELANGGTLFLDEIADLPLATQAKLLRVLQDNEVYVLGKEKPVSINVRIVAATNKNMKQLIEEKKFREDLYYRINVLEMYVPPLRERKDDIEVIANYLLMKHTNKIGKRITNFSSKVIDLFLHHEWNGNIRELENIIEASIYLCDTEIIDTHHLPAGKFQHNELHANQQNQQGLKDLVKQYEKEVIQQYLQIYNFNKQKVMNALQISQSSLYEKLKEYQLIDSKNSE